MRINRRRARLQPNRWRPRQPLYRLAQHPSRFHPRIDNLAPILRPIPTIHTPPREIDQHICAFQLLRPRSEILAVPLHKSNIPPITPRPSRKHHHLMLPGKSTLQHPPHLPSPTCENNLHLNLCTIWYSFVICAFVICHSVPKFPTPNAASA